MTLKWASDQFVEQIVPEEYFYSKNEFPPLQITELDPNQMVLSKFDNYSLVFKTKNNFFFTDIPSEYRGLTTIKFITRIHMDTIKFRVNSPINVFIGVLSHYPNPLPETFEDMQETFQVVQVKPGTPLKDVNKIITLNF